MDRARDARLRIKFLSLNHPLCFTPAVKVAFKFFFFFFLNFFIYYRILVERVFKFFIRRPTPSN